MFIVILVNTPFTFNLLQIVNREQFDGIVIPSNPSTASAASSPSS